ncbi:hypothetical protein SAMN05444288_1118 [Hoylesella oralis]|nr:hypothetical protein SAMN05444288_1118 [Hoylesella oralis]
MFIKLILNVYKNGLVIFSRLRRDELMNRQASKSPKSFQIISNPTIFIIIYRVTGYRGRARFRMGRNMINHAPAPAAPPMKRDFTSRLPYGRSRYTRLRAAGGVRRRRGGRPRGGPAGHTPDRPSCLPHRPSCRRCRWSRRR